MQTNKRPANQTKIDLKSVPNSGWAARAAIAKDLVGFSCLFDPLVDDRDTWLPALLVGLPALIIMYHNNLNAKVSHRNESTSIIYFAIWRLVACGMMKCANLLFFFSGVLPSQQGGHFASLRQKEWEKRCCDTVFRKISRRVQPLECKRN